MFDGGFSDILAHAIVNTPPRQNDLGVVTDLFRLVGKIKGIDADAMSPDQTRGELEKVPFGASRFEYGLGRDIEPIEDDSQFVHQGDIKIPLSIFDNFSRFGHLDGGCPMHPCGHHQLIDPGHRLQSLGILPGNHFNNFINGMHLVAGIDPFRRITDLEIDAVAQARFLFQNRHANIFGHTRIHS